MSKCECGNVKLSNKRQCDECIRISKNRDKRKSIGFKLNNIKQLNIKKKITTPDFEFGTLHWLKKK